MLFQEANYYEPIKYEEHFNSSNEIIEAENEEIKRILIDHINLDLTITDIGCGSGLGRKLLKDIDYVGIDNAEKSIEYCKEHYKGSFYCEDAESYINRVDSFNPIFLFSLDYLSLDTIEKAINKTDQVFIAVHYNKPFLSKTSIYSSKETIFYELHPVEEIRAKLDLFDRYQAITYKLLDQDYYYISIISKFKNL